jgi:(E)-4-hydroxy-3-methylbut-2-enyl-diphosphate synthase
MNKIYCNSLTEYSRRKTREVFIGNVPLGGNNPIRVQSMTTVDTMDTKGSVEQALRMVDSGCEYVRITAPSMKEAQNLENIKNELIKRGCDVPLVADIGNRVYRCYLCLGIDKNTRQIFSTCRDLQSQQYCHENWD